jgi:transcription elongation GreA/GreB family factor
MAINIPRRQWSQRPPPNNEPVYLTADGLRRLQERLARLKKNLPAAIDETARTSAYGDHSDNAEYKEAKSILRRTHRQIFAIEDQLKRIVVIAAGPDAEGKIQLGSTVVMELGGERKTYRIVGPSEADPSRGRISHVSPLGSALIGHARGDIVTLQTPHGNREYTIVEVR